MLHFACTQAPIVPKQTRVGQSGTLEIYSVTRSSEICDAHGQNSVMAVQKTARFPTHFTLYFTVQPTDTQNSSGIFVFFTLTPYAAHYKRLSRNPIGIKGFRRKYP